MVEFSVDEMTIVISLSENKELLGGNEWESLAEWACRQVETVLSLQEVFGSRTTCCRPVQGYTEGYAYGNHPFYFCVCYHEAYWKMGIAIKFSAQALAYYRDKTSELFGTTEQVYDMIQLLVDCFQEWKVNFSRIDFAVDFIDENINVGILRKQLESGELHFEFSTGRVNPSILSYYSKDDVVDTLYVGAKKKNVTSLLRIYNKRKEQLQSYGTQLEKARKCTTWVRVENEIKGAYAHAITEELLHIHDSDAMVQLIARCINNKYSLVYENGQKHFITEILEDASTGSSYYFSDKHYKDLSLQKSLEYLTFHSGLITFLYKVGKIDTTVLDKLWQYWLDYLITAYQPNDDTNKWMKDHQTYYRENGINFDFTKEKDKN